MLSRSITRLTPTLLRRTRTLLPACTRSVTLPSSTSSGGSAGGIDEQPDTFRERWQQQQNKAKKFGKEATQNRQQSMSDDASEVSTDLKEQLSDSTQKIKRAAKPNTASSNRSSASSSGDMDGTSSSLRGTDRPNSFSTRGPSGVPSTTTTGAPSIERDSDRPLGSYSASVKKFHTSARQNIDDDLKDDARRLKDKAGNKLHAARLKAEEVGIDIKEGAQEAWHKAKKGARHLKEKLEDSLPVLGSDPYDQSNPITQRASLRDEGAEIIYDKDDLSSDVSRTTTNSSGGKVGAMTDREASLEDRGDLSRDSSSAQVASSAFSPEDLTSESEPVRNAARSEVLSTSRGRGLAWDEGIGKDQEDLSEVSSGSLGVGQHSLKKSFLDGPQEMPQGVGKRARDAEGKPMETGTERS